MDFARLPTRTIARWLLTAVAFIAIPLLSVGCSQDDSTAGGDDAAAVNDAGPEDTFVCYRWKVSALDATKGCFATEPVDVGCITAEAVNGATACMASLDGATLYHVPSGTVSDELIADGKFKACTDKEREQVMGASPCSK